MIRCSFSVLVFSSLFIVLIAVSISLGEGLQGRYILDHGIELMNLTDNNVTESSTTTAQDILDIVEVSTGIIRFSFFLSFDMGHSCSMEGIASGSNNRFWYSEKTDGEYGYDCHLSIRVSDDKIFLEDQKGECAKGNCGVRGCIDHVFLRSSRKDLFHK